MLDLIYVFFGNAISNKVYRTFVISQNGYKKTSLNIPIGESKVINRRTGNTMVKEKGQLDLQKTL